MTVNSITIKIPRTADVSIYYHRVRLFDERNEDHEPQNLPNSSRRLRNGYEVHHDIVPKPLAHKGQDNHRDNKGQQGGYEVHVDFTTLRV